MTASTLEIVVEAIADALGHDEDEITPEASLLGDLGAESIDLLDILFRIERASGVKIQASDLADHLQGGIPDEEFGSEDGHVSAVGLAHLKKVLPQIDTEALAGNLEAEQVLGLFTVQNLVDLVRERQDLMVANAA
jgi:acyl carrier protein